MLFLHIRDALKHAISDDIIVSEIASRMCECPNTPSGMKQAHDIAWCAFSHHCLEKKEEVEKADIALCELLFPPFKGLSVGWEFNRSRKQFLYSTPCGKNIWVSSVQDPDLPPPSANARCLGPVWKYITSCSTEYREIYLCLPELTKQKFTIPTNMIVSVDPPVKSTYNTTISSLQQKMIMSEKKSRKNRVRTLNRNFPKKIIWQKKNRKVFNSGR